MSGQNDQDVDKDGEEGGGEDPVADLIDDIMLLNEEVESQDGHVTMMRRHLHSLAEVLQEAHLEELGERDEHVSAAKLALELVKTYSQLKTLEAKLLEQLQSIGDQTSRDPLSTPLPYMLQLPPTQVSKSTFCVHKREGTIKLPYPVFEISFLSRAWRRLKSGSNGCTLFLIS